VAIDHARRVNALARRHRIAEGIVDLLCAAREASDRPADRIVQAAASVLGAQRVTLYEVDPASRELVLLRAGGAVRADTDTVREQDLVELAVRDARAVSVPDAAAGAGTDATAGVAAFAVPLKSGTAVVGALGFVAAPERRFAPDIIELAERFAMGAVALLTPSVAGEARRLSGRAADDLGERAGGIVWEADAYSGRFTFVSRRAEPLTGYGIGEWRGDAEFWGRLVHPEDRAEAARRRAEAMREGTDFDLEYRILTKSGRAVRVRDSARAVRDATGTLRQWRGVMVELAVSVRMREAGEHLEQLPLL
jgi:PAS domain S-box-containing protein